MNRHMSRLTLLLITLTTSFAACKTGKQPVRKQLTIEKRYGTIGVDTPGAPQKALPDTKAPVLNNQKKELITSLLPLWNKEITYNTFSGKAKLHAELRAAKYDFTAHIRMVKNKSVWMNITAVGGIVNVARILVRPDSVFLVNHLERSVTVKPVAELNQLFPVPVDFAMLQNLLVGNVIQRNGTPVDATDFGGTWSLQTDSRELTQNVTYNKADSTIRTLQMLLKPDNDPQGMMQYGNYESADGRKFATSRVIGITSKEEPYYMDMNFSNVEFDKEVDLPFSIPKTYTRK